MPRKTSSGPIAKSSRAVSKRAGTELASRQSKRARTTKQSYVDPVSDEDVEDVASTCSEKGDGSKESEYEAGNTKDASSESDHDHEDPSSEDDGTQLGNGTNKGRKAVPSSNKKKKVQQEIWKANAKLAPGTRVIIKRPKAREAGDTPYTDDTIHPNTMLFLEDLAAHNDRQWLKGRAIPCIYLQPLAMEILSFGRSW